MMETKAYLDNSRAIGSFYHKKLCSCWMCFFNPKHVTDQRYFKSASTMDLLFAVIRKSGHNKQNIYHDWIADHLQTRDNYTRIWSLFWTEHNRFQHQLLNSLSPDGLSQYFKTFNKYFKDDKKMRDAVLHSLLHLHVPSKESIEAALNNGFLRDDIQLTNAMRISIHCDVEFYRWLFDHVLVDGRIIRSNFADIENVSFKVLSYETRPEFVAFFLNNGLEPDIEDWMSLHITNATQRIFIEHKKKVPLRVIKTLPTSLMQLAQRNGCLEHNIEDLVYNGLFSEEKFTSWMKTLTDEQIQNIDILKLPTMRRKELAFKFFVPVLQHANHCEIRKMLRKQTEVEVIQHAVYESCPEFDKEISLIVSQYAEYIFLE